MTKLLALLLAAASSRAGMTLASFDQGTATEAAGRPAVYFSDKDESAASKTQVGGTPQAGGASGKSLRLNYRIVENPSLGYQYGGFAIPLEGKSIAAFAELSFYLHSPDGSVPPMTVTLTNQAHERDKVALSRYVAALPKGRWVKVSVPLADFKVLRRPDMLKEMASVAFVFESGQGALDFDQVALEGVREAQGGPALKAPPKARAVWKKGHCAWAYHDKDWNIARILKYNKSALKGRRILYVFPWTGSYTFKPSGQTRLDWEEGEALYYAQKLAGDKEVEIHPMIDASSEGFEELSDRDIDALARLTAARLNARKEFAGIQIDIEPHNSLVHGLFAALRKYTKKPISIAVGRWTGQTFEYADAVALMMYDLSDKPEGYGRAAHRKLADFMRDARKHRGQAFVGMPAAATHHEYAYKFEKASGRRVESGFSMEAYMEWAFKGVQKYCGGDKFQQYVGMGVWGLLGNKAVGLDREPYEYFPFEISEASWQYFRRPID